MAHPPAPPHPARVLLIHAHPAAHVSRVNRTLLAAARALDCVAAHDLYAIYPDGFIDVRREQALLQRHPVVVLQHPLYWYSVPALLKEWIDLVLEYGWAYGPGGEALAGHHWTHAFSAGGNAEAYSAQGHNQRPIGEYLHPLSQTAHLCGMRWHAPFIVHNARQLDDGALAAEAQRYVRWLQALAREGRPAAEAIA